MAEKQKQADGKIASFGRNSSNFGWTSRQRQLRCQAHERGFWTKRNPRKPPKVYRTMSEMGMIHRRRTPHGTTKATTGNQDRENLIKRDFKAEKPLQKLLSDITEIQCYDGKLYVSAVLDCYNGEILSVAMDSKRKRSTGSPHTSWRGIRWRALFSGTYSCTITESAYPRSIPEGFRRLHTENGRKQMRRRQPDGTAPHLNFLRSATLHSVNSGAFINVYHI